MGISRHLEGIPKKRQTSLFGNVGLLPLFVFIGRWLLWILVLRYLEEVPKFQPTALKPGSRERGIPSPSGSWGSPGSRLKGFTLLLWENLIQTTPSICAPPPPLPSLIIMLTVAKLAFCKTCKAPSHRQNMSWVVLARPFFSSTKHNAQLDDNS